MEIKTNFIELSKQIMREKGLQPDFTEEEMRQAAAINEPASPSPQCVDLRSLLWTSIDNDDSRDLDQLTYAEQGKDSTFTFWVAIADVDSLVEKDSPIDEHARKNTTSVYTPAKVFAMLPEKLSTDLTSLNENEDRLAVVVKIQIDKEGVIGETSIFEALVHNYAKLTYNSVGGWLHGDDPIPEKVKQINGLEQLLLLQHEIAQKLRKKRHVAGSLTLESTRTEVKMQGDDKIILQTDQHNYAHQLIEEFMIAANRTIASYFRENQIASLRRVVRIPKYWDKIIALAAQYGDKLPKEPNSKALDTFLIKRKDAEPDSFPDLSLTVIKLLGRGEYIVENYKDSPVGHFGLAIAEYTHFTAPNRRFPDLVSQRQFKAHNQNTKTPYSIDELYRLADHCTTQEDAATKVERRLNKSAAAIYLSSQIGTIYKGIITGLNSKGTWVRLLDYSIEGMVVQAARNVEIGDKVNVQLKRVDVLNGFIDFAVLR